MLFAKYCIDKALLLWGALNFVSLKVRLQVDNLSGDSTGDCLDMGVAGLEAQLMLRDGVTRRRSSLRSILSGSKGLDGVIGVSNYSSALRSIRRTSNV